MSNQNDTNCPKCGSAIPEDAPGGLCPACVLERAATVPGHTGTGRGNAAPPTVEEIAPHFPELEVLELLGAGGMGAVYKARQPQLDRTVAIKILSGALSDDPAFVERFNREARVLARLSHPNIVTVFDFGTAGPYCYLLMEHIDGVNLRQAMRTGGFTPPEALALVQEICAALQFAHEEGILHRDIKPENVLIDTKGRVKIADFGIAKLVGESEQENMTLTMQGSILGSPHYMAPEQIETPGDVDQRADIYSLGVVLYEMLTGELPIGRFALPSEKATMDSRIDEIVLRTLEKERQARFQSAGEVMTQMGALSATPPPAPPAPPAPAGAPGNHGAARFSLISPILTGLSLLLAVLTLYLAETLRDRDVRTIATVIGLVLAGGSAIVGFILGSVALGSIRKSGGQLGGLGSSVFAVVVWPVLLLGVLGTFFLKLPTPGGSSFGPLVVVFFIGIPQILAGLVLVRGLRRWARGVVGKDGEQHFPGLGRTILTAIGLIILGVVLLEVVSRVLPPSERDLHYAEMEREMEREMRRAVSASSSEPWPSEDIGWLPGEPNVMLPVELHPGISAEFRLVRIGDKGEPEYGVVGTLEGDVEDALVASSVAIGKFASRGHGVKTDRGFAAMLTGTGKTGGVGGESDFRGWEFVKDLGSTTHVFDEPGRYLIFLARREGLIGTPDQLLQLEVVVSKR